MRINPKTQSNYIKERCSDHHKATHNVFPAYPSILCCLGVAAGIEHSILAVTLLKRTESTWMGFPSTLLLQRVFVREIKHGIGTEEASLMLRRIIFSLALS